MEGFGERSGVGSGTVLCSFFRNGDNLEINMKRVCRENLLKEIL